MPTDSPFVVDLALSSHLLVLYREQFDPAFPARALEEMLRSASRPRSWD
ncbi:MAG: hypothetical protein OXG35_07145 [Acidobacteria bacterium]|nr:hypothetical protein [Acidobacteriota bacterium]